MKYANSSIIWVNSKINVDYHIKVTRCERSIALIYVCYKNKYFFLDKIIWKNKFWSDIFDVKENFIFMTEVVSVYMKYNIIVFEQFGI